MIKRLSGLVIIVSLVLYCRSIGSQPADRTINLGLHSLHVVVVGTGSPAVVFDGGIGARCNEYRELQDRIAAATTAVTYDRAGYGSSEVGPLPRDSRTEAEELRTLLVKLKIPPPYILVGHSLGGLNIQVFAGLYPEEVAGMVLLDPPPLRFILGEAYVELASMAARMTEEWQGIADADSSSGNDQEKVNPEFFQMIASEHREMFNSSSKQASMIASFDGIPLVVVASGIPNPMFGDVAESFQKFWATESEALVVKSSQGQFVFVETSSHRLHDDAEDLVTNKILSMVRSSRNSGH